MTLREIRKLYDRYRKKYYAESIPPAKEIKWAWAKEGKSLMMNPKTELACTIKYPDGSFTIEINECLKTQPRLLAVMLFHECSHIYNWSAGHGPWWESEAIRLGSLGAMREFL